MAIRYLDEQSVEQPRKIKFLDEDLSLFDRTMSDLSQRGKNISESFDATNFIGQPQEGQQSAAEFAMQGVGQGIGAAGDVLGNLAVSGYKEFAPELVQKAVSSGMQQFGQSGTGQALGGLVNEYQQWEQENPRAARNVGALGNIASVMPWGRATTAAGKGLKQTANSFKSKVDDIVKVADKMDSATLKKAANEAFAAADAAGAGISPSDMKVFARDVTAAADMGTDIGKVAALKAGKATGIKQVEAAKDIINGMVVDDSTVSGLLTGAKNSSPISLRSFDEVDKTLSEMLYAKGSKLLTDKGQLNRAGQQVKAMQEGLREKVFNASGDGFKVLDNARTLWGKQLKMRDLEEMIGRALNTKQPNSSLKKYFGDLLNKIETRGKTKFNYTKQEVDAIRKIADSGKIDEFLSLFGSRLPSSIMAGTGDFVGGAALRGASELPRTLATRAQLGKTQNLLNTIAGAPQSSMGVDIARGSLRAAGKAPANMLGMVGTGMQYRTPQLTGLGLLGQLNEEDLQQ